jgi:hypothetical protein
LELDLSCANLHFVGWVEPAPSFVGFRCTQPNLHFASVIAKCETQQRPISKPSPKSFFFDQTGRFFGQRPRSYETTFVIFLTIVSLLIRLAAVQARGRAYIKLRQHGTVS